MLQLCVYQDIEYLGSLESTQEARLAHKSSFWARSATVSGKRDRTSAEREARASESWGPTTPDQKTKRTTLRKSNKRLELPSAQLFGLLSALQTSHLRMNYVTVK